MNKYQKSEQFQSVLFTRHISAEALDDHRGRLRVTKMSTRRMAMRRSLSEVMARMVSWARFSNGRTARSHQHQAGPLGLACRRTRTQVQEYPAAPLNEEEKKQTRPPKPTCGSESLLGRCPK